MRRALHFISSAVEFDEYRLHLKSVTCPHCRAVGHLNRHGYLRGYAERGSEQVVRGWRIFCSDRGRHRGCDRTHSVLLAEFLRRRSVRAAQFWKFLAGLLSGLNMRAAWESVASAACPQYGDRLWKVFVGLQSRLRSLLCRVQPPPSSSGKNPILQTIDHLRRVFAAADCPVSAFQIHFQRRFIG